MDSEAETYLALCGPPSVALLLRLASHSLVAMNTVDEDYVRNMVELAKNVPTPLLIENVGYKDRKASENLRAKYWLTAAWRLFCDGSMESVYPACVNSPTKYGHQNMNVVF